MNGKMNGNINSIISDNNNVIKNNNNINKDTIDNASNSDNNMNGNNNLIDYGDLKIKEIREAIVKGISLNSLAPIRDAVSHLTRLDDFNVVKLSAGFFSEVFKVTHMSTRKVMVLKMNKKAVNRGNALKEIELLNKLNHPNIVAFMGTVVHEGQLHPLLEYLNFGTLESLIKRFYDQKVIDHLVDDLSSHTSNSLVSATSQSSSSSSTTTSQCPSKLSFNNSTLLNSSSSNNCHQDNQNIVKLFNKLAKDVAQGMRYLHHLGYIHRDLTSRNIFIRRNFDLTSPITWDSQDLTAVIGDFGFAANEPMNDEQKLPTVGSPYWLSPECLRGFWYNHKSDIFSFGIICCELNWRVPADPDFLPRDNDFLVIFDKLPTHLNQTLLAKIAKLSTNFNPELRPEFSEIIEMFNECTPLTHSNLVTNENQLEANLNTSSSPMSSSYKSENVNNVNDNSNDKGDIFDQHLHRRQNSNYDLIRQNSLCLTRKSLSPQRITYKLGSTTSS